EWAVLGPEDRRPLACLRRELFGLSLRRREHGTRRAARATVLPRVIKVMARRSYDRGRGEVCELRVRESGGGALLHELRGGAGAGGAPGGAQGGVGALRRSRRLYEPLGAAGRGGGARDAGAVS